MSRLCLTAGCGVEVKARGLCDSHYQQAWRAGMLDEFPAGRAPIARPEPTGPPLCRCRRPVMSRDWFRQCVYCELPVFAAFSPERQARMRERWPNFMRNIAGQVIMSEDDRGVA